MIGWRRALASTLGTLWLTLPAAALAQDDPTSVPKPDKGKGKLEIELPAENKPRSAVPRTPADLVEALLPELSGYPSASCSRAMEQIVLAGPGAAPALRMLLNGQTLGPRVPAALVLADLDDQDAVPGIVRLLDEDRALRHAPALFDALSRLDPATARETAVRFAGDRNARRAGHGLRYLETHSDGAGVAALKSLLDARRAQVREQAFQILAGLPGVDLEAEALALLGDPSGSLCHRASAWLVDAAAARADRSALVDRLVASAEERVPSRGGCWALLTLAELAEDHDDPALAERVLGDDDRMLRMEQRLLSQDALTRLSAALALAEVGFRADTDEAEIMLSERVLPTLMESFLRNEYFEDLLPLLELSRTRVRRITGLDLGTDLARWREAWTGDGGAPLVRRDLPPSRVLDHLDELVVRFQRRGLLLTGPDREIVLATDTLLPEGAAPRGPEGSLYLPAERMREVIEGLMESGVFERGRRAAVEETARGYRLIRIGAGRRERTIVADPDGDPAFDAAEAALVAVADGQWWQRLYLGNPADIGGHYRRERARFDEADDPDAWTRSYLHALQVALPGLEPPARSRALAVVLRRPDIIATIGLEDGPNLIAALAGEPSTEGAWSILTEIVLRNGDPDLRALTMSTLVDQYGEDARSAVVALLSDESAVRAALADGRSLVRLFAVRAAVGMPGVEREVVSLAEGDPDPRVRREAVMALARSSTPGQSERIAAYARGARPALQNAALEALGHTRHPEAATLLAAAARDQTGSTRRAALRGLAILGGAGLATLRTLAVDPEAAPDARQEVVASLGSSPDPAARELLAELLEAEPLEVREEAACQLALAGDMRAASVLIALLDEPLRAARSLDFLALLFSVDGGARGEVFVRLYQNEPYRTADEWFRQTLLAESTSILGEEIDGAPLYALLDALRDTRWFLRANALRRLEEAFGVTHGDPPRFATAEQYHRVADRWERYLETRTVVAAEGGGAR